MSALGSQTAFERLTELRAENRFSAFLVAYLEADGKQWPARLRNLSPIGALVEAETGFTLGSKLVFRRGRVAVKAEVIWARGGRFGISFAHRLDALDLEAISRRMA